MGRVRRTLRHRARFTPMEQASRHRSRVPAASWAQTSTSLRFKVEVTLMRIRQAALAIALLMIGSAGAVVRAQAQGTTNAWPLPEIGLPLPHIGLPPQQAPARGQQPVTAPPSWGQLPAAPALPAGRPIYSGISPFPSVVYVMPYPVIAMPVPVAVDPSVGAPSRRHGADASSRRREAEPEAPPASPAPAPAAPAPVPTPAPPPPPSTVYIIPGCYAGNVPPSNVVLRTGCDAANAVTIENR